STHEGERGVNLDPKTGFISSESYDLKKIPSSYVIERTGDHPGSIALTFDDGPDPAWTPAILDILKKENVPATFFVIGKNGQAYRDLLRRIVAENHDRASDTHPDARGKVVLLHDSGGDRAATIEALPRLIEELRANGFKFVLVSDLGGWSRDQVMPMLPPSESVYTRTDAIAFLVFSTGGWLLQWAFIIGIILGLGRLVLIGALAFAQWLRSRQRERHRTGERYEP